MSEQYYYRNFLDGKLHLISKILGYAGGDFMIELDRDGSTMWASGKSILSNSALVTEQLSGIKAEGIWERK